MTLVAWKRKTNAMITIIQHVRRSFAIKYKTAAIADPVTNVPQTFNQNAVPSKLLRCSRCCTNSRTKMLSNPKEAS